MDRILELLALGAAITDEQRTELLGLVAALSRDDVEGCRDALRAAGAELLAADATDETLAALGVVSAASTALVERIAALDADDANRETQRAELAEAIAALDPDNADPENPDPDDPDAAPVDDPDAAPAETPPADDAAETPPVAEPVAAAATPQPRISNVNARRPPASQPHVPAAQVQRAPLVAAGAYAGAQPGQELDAEMAIRTWEEAYIASQEWIGGNPKIPVQSMRALAMFPNERRLTGDSAENTRKVAAATNTRALAAAGGICAPINVDYSLPVVGSTDRPVRDALARFGAEARGGVSTLPPPILGAAAAGITVWTHANDLAALPGGASPDPAVKAKMRATCPTPETTTVDAVVGRLVFGNFGLRYFREQAEAWQRLLLVEQARVAENKLLTTIAAGSEAVTVGELLSTERDVLAGLDRATAGFVYRHRDPNMRFAFIAPGWMQNNIRTSVARGIPVGTMDETLALADAAIARWFAARGITPAWHLDGETGQGFSAQIDGTLNPWPDTAITYLHPVGEWLFLDGGEFNQGIYRDSVLNDTNDAEFFAETFENAHHHGRESLRITFDIVPNGTYSCCTEIDIATTGS